MVTWNAAHAITTETSDYITLGDLNFDPGDNTARAEMVIRLLNQRSYDDTDLLYHTSSDYTHKSGRLLDRIVATSNVTRIIEDVAIRYSFLNSDHFPVTSIINVDFGNVPNVVSSKVSLNWKTASEKALFSYSCLSQKKCSKSLKKYKSEEIDGIGLYQELVSNLDEAACLCIPKYKLSNTTKRHNMPMWQEYMPSFKHEVDYWTQIQFFKGGPTRCPPFICLQLRLAKSRYRRQFRVLKREAEVNTAEKVTVSNCFRQLFNKTKPPSPAMIDGHSKPAQVIMWQNHFKDVFRAEEHTI